METYIDILKKWERDIADPAIYERLDTLIPELKLKRIGAGTARDRWVSPLKADLSSPKRKNPEKTVISRSDMRIREQGEWAESQSVISRLMEDNDLKTVYEAYRLAADKIGLDMPLPGSKEVSETIRKAERRKTLIDTLTDYMEWNLVHNKGERAEATRKYLKEKRGLGYDDWERFSIGYLPGMRSIYKYMEKKGYSKEEVDESFGIRAGAAMSHPLAIPYICGGENKGFIFRRVEKGEGPKYMATAGLDRKSIFFNMPPDKEPKGILVVEGELDAITATCNGFPNVVAMGGSDISGDKIHQVIDAFERNTRRITLCPDLDTSQDGRADTGKRHLSIMRTIHTIKEVDIHFDDIDIVTFPGPADPDSFIRTHGPEAFWRILEKAEPYWEYLYKHKQENR